MIRKRCFSQGRCALTRATDGNARVTKVVKTFCYVLQTARMLCGAPAQPRRAVVVKKVRAGSCLFGWSSLQSQERCSTMNLFMQMSFTLAPLHSECTGVGMGIHIQ